MRYLLIGACLFLFPSVSVPVLVVVGICRLLSGSFKLIQDNPKYEQIEEQGEEDCSALTAYRNEDIMFCSSNMQTREDTDLSVSAQKQIIKMQYEFEIAKYDMQQAQDKLDELRKTDDDLCADIENILTNEDKRKKLEKERIANLDRICKQERKVFIAEQKVEKLKQLYLINGMCYDEKERGV